MIPLVGLWLGGATLTDRDALPAGQAAVGRPAWSPSALLGDLELRLGLPSNDEDEAVRAQHWSQRIHALADPAHFYAASYEIDPVGTAAELLSWRDELVAAGWNGERVPDGGARLDALFELEWMSEPVLPATTGDRLRRVEQELATTGLAPYEAIELAEEPALWSARWRRVFDVLAKNGTAVRQVEPAFDGADPDSDLGRVQATLAGTASSASLRGDGSLVVLTADTSWEGAQITAALLRKWRDAEQVVVLRGGDERALDLALGAQGLASQGATAASPWRPALQLLPLALELVFEPRDPYRVLELVTLPIGPFQGWAGRKLADALGGAPGIGGRPWQAAKEELGPAKRERVEEWLEQPGYSAVEGAPRAAVLAAVDRVLEWTRKRLAVSRGERAGLLASAHSQARALRKTFEHDPREAFDLVATRQRVEEVVGFGSRSPASYEGAGRLDHVSTPAGLRCSRDVVVWWHCVAGTEWQPGPRIWRQAELAALQAAGVELPDRSAQLAVEAQSWRWPILAARQRVVLVTPRHAMGSALDAHPIVDEIVARLAAPEEDMARITVDCAELVSADVPALVVPDAPTAVELEPLRLPQPRPEWSLQPGSLQRRSSHSASSLGSLIGCPLGWTFKYPAGLSSGSVGSLPTGPRLNGKLGHRLIEELHAEDGLSGDVSSAVDRVFDRLLPEEGAVLLREGMAMEVEQLRSQLRRSVEALVELLEASGLRIVGVEVQIDVAWRDGKLGGRLDLLLSDPDGKEAVVDLKWGKSTHENLLANGQAVQLAVYASARRLATGESKLPPAGYFSLANGKLLTTQSEPFAGAQRVSGPDLDETWQRLERTVDLVRQLLDEGRVVVTGVRQSLPLLDAAGVSDEARPTYLDMAVESGCRYCDYDALCGKKWQDLS